MLGLKLNHVSKRGHRSRCFCIVICFFVLFIAMCFLSNLFISAQTAACEAEMSSMRLIIYWGRDNMATVLQRTFSNSLYCVQFVVFWFKFYRNLFPREPWVSISLEGGPATSHYLNQWWSCLLTHIRITRPWWVNNSFTILTINL